MYCSELKEGECAHSEGWAVWITGLPGSGKSTIAKVLVRELREKNLRVQLLSVDMLRKVLTPRPTYSEEERKIVYDGLILIARLLSKNSVNVLIDATGNRRSYRNNARRRIKLFMEAYVHCPLDVCMIREKRRKLTSGAPRGVYRKAEKSQSLTVPGVGVPYEVPFKPEIFVDSLRLTPKQSAEKILKVILQRFEKNMGICEA
jgi:adenylylsulfate kinase